MSIRIADCVEPSRERTGRLRRRGEKDHWFMWPSVDLKYAETGDGAEFIVVDDGCR